MTKQQPARRGRGTFGSRIREWWTGKGCVLHSDLLRDRIDKYHQIALRRAVKEAYHAGYCDSQWFLSKPEEQKKRIEKKYGIKL